MTNNQGCIFKLKILNFLALLYFIFLLIVSEAYPSDIYFYSGAAFIKPVREIARLYKNSLVHVISGGSGRLLNEIILSKKGDIFLPGSDYYITLLKKKNIIYKSNKFIIQKPVIGVSKREANHVKTFYDIINKKLKIASGNPDTMALGKIFQKIEPKIHGFKELVYIRALNISQIVNYLKLNIVDAGILFDSVAKCNNIKYFELPNNIQYNNITTSISILKFTSNLKHCIKFYNYLLDHKYIFRKYGFIVHE